jgi:hypothetical protein
MNPLNVIAVVVGLAGLATIPVLLICVARSTRRGSPCLAYREMTPDAS